MIACANCAESTRQEMLEYTTCITFASWACFGRIVKFCSTQDQIKKNKTLGRACDYEPRLFGDDFISTICVYDTETRIKSQGRLFQHRFSSKGVEALTIKGGCAPPSMPRPRTWKQTYQGVLGLKLCKLFVQHIPFSKICKKSAVDIPTSYMKNSNSRGAPQQ